VDKSDNRWFIIDADPNSLTWVEKTALDYLMEKGWGVFKLSDMMTVTDFNCSDKGECNCNYPKH